MHVLAIKRSDPATGKETVELPGPQMQLREGDRLAVIGQGTGIDQFRGALTGAAT